MKSEQIKWMIQNKRVKLSSTLMLSHYAIVLYILFIPALTVYSLLEIYITKTYNGVRSATELMTATFPWIIPAIALLYLQRRRLKFTEVSLTYSDEDFEEAITRAVSELGWENEYNNKRFFRAYRSFNYSLSWGEMITIIRLKNKLLVNSICDPNKISSVSSFGWNKKNVRSFLQILHDVKESIPPKQVVVKKPINEWSIGRTIFRLLIYSFCFFLIALGVYMLLNPLTFHTQIAGVGAIGAAIFYLYLDLKVITSKKSKV